MKIVFTGRFSFPEGMASTKRIKNYIHYLHKNGYDIEVLLPYNDSQNKEYGSNFNVSNAEVKIIWNLHTHNYIKILLLPLINFLMILHLLNNPKSSKEKVLFVYDGISYENILVILLAKLSGYKILVDVVEDYSLHEEKISLASKIRISSFLFFEKFYHRLVDGLIVISDYLEIKFHDVKNYNIPLKKIPVSAFYDNYQTSNGEPGEVKIFYGGGAGQKDGLNILLLAFSQILKYYPGSRLYISGVSRESNEIPVTESIKLLGFLPEKIYYETIRSMDILCVPRTDSPYAAAGFPFKLAEYLSTGNIVVASELEELKKRLVDKQEIFFAKPNNADDLVEVLKYVLDNWEMAKGVGENGFEAGKMQFDVNIIGIKIEEILNAIFLKNS